MTARDAATQLIVPRGNEIAGDPRSPGAETVGEPTHPRLTSRNDGLDLIRATGAVLVFATHLYHSFGLTWLGPVAAGGLFGVYLFFPLSGYLLYRPFVSGAVALGPYARARIARLAPAYYLVVGVAALLGIIPGIVANPLPTLTFTTNVLPSDTAGFGQSWTLGVELAFYLLLPLIAAATRRRGILLIALTGLSWAWWTHVDGWWLEQFPTLFWAFGVGMLVARYGDRLRRVVKAWPLGVALVLLGVLSPRGADLVALGGAVLIAAAVAYRPRLPFARWPADVSYGVYLWHVAVTIAVVRAGLPILAAVPITFAIATASWRFLERPILRYVTRPRLADQAVEDRADQVQAGSWRPSLGRDPLDVRVRGRDDGADRDGVARPVADGVG